MLRNLVTMAVEFIEFHRAGQNQIEPGECFSLKKNYLTFLVTLCAGNVCYKLKLSRRQLLKYRNVVKSMFVFHLFGFTAAIVTNKAKIKFTRGR